MTPEQQAEIDALSLEAMLRIWRFGRTDTQPLLNGKAGEYLQQRMFGWRNRDNDAWVAASKAVGWGTPE